jgi:predicted acylesterase/phospholipase RssA
MSTAQSNRPPEVDEVQFEVFVRKARNAARQCLFFLYDLQPLDLKLLAPDTEFALRQTRSLVDGVHIPTRFAESAKKRAEPDAPVAHEHTPPLRGWRRLVDLLVERDGAPAELFDLNQKLIGKSRSDRLSEFMRDRQSPSDNAERMREEARTVIFKFWSQRIWLRLHKTPSLDSAVIGELIVQFQAFLRITRPNGPVAYFTLLVQKLGLLLLRNAALLFGCIALMATWKQEVLASLVLNGGLLSLLPFVFVAASGVISLALGTRLRNRVGKSAFYRVAYMAEEPERGIHSWPHDGEFRRRLGNTELKKALVMVILVLLFSLTFWGLGVRGLADPTRRTLFVLAALSWGALSTLHAFDLWDFIDPRPIRFMLLIGLALLGFGVLTGWHREVAYAVFGGMFVAWLANAIRRLPHKPSAVSVVMGACCAFIVASVWFGNRTLDQAAWRTSLTTAKPTNASSPERVVATAWPFPSRLDDGTPAPVVVIAASGGGSRAAIYTALTLQALHRDFPEIALNLQAISSVSGGSLGSAAYVAERYRQARNTASRPQPWQQLVDDTSRDFLYPTLWGALVPGSSRGQAIESDWDEHVGLGGLQLANLAAAWREQCEISQADTTKAAHPPFPLPLFNACTLDTHAAVITPLSSEAYLDPYDDASRYDELRAEYGVSKDVELTWVHDRDVVYPLEVLNHAANPTLAEAVRASANFPFGFPLVDVQTEKVYGPGWVPVRRKLVSLTDGGVLSNSGLWTLFHLLTNDTQRDKLVQRGVLLIVVDASKMPEYSPDRRNFASLYGAIQDQNPIAQSLHRRMFELLFLIYGDAIRVVKVDLVPSVVNNVYTTWALDKKSQDRLRSSFDRVWSGKTAKVRVHDKLDESWNVLTARARDLRRRSAAAGVNAERQVCGAGAVAPGDAAPARVKRAEPISAGPNTPHPSSGEETSKSAASVPPASRPESPAAPKPVDQLPGVKPASQEGVAHAKWRASAASMLRPPLD